MSNKLETVTMNELFDSIYQSNLPIVENLLYSGTYLFVGAPKVGKSFFMAQLAYCISSGMRIWDKEGSHGAVLYLALEDDYARLQSRLSGMFGVDSVPDLHLAIQANKLSEGLEEQLETFVKEHKDVKVIIIDTLQKVREAYGDKCSYGSDYEVVTKLKKFSDKYNVCLLVVHHTRKMEANDCFDMISGTNGLLGAADGAFVMQKDKRTGNSVILEMAGRDQQDQRFHLQFNRNSCTWELEKEETELGVEPEEPLLELIEEMLFSCDGKWSGMATQLLEKIPEIELQPNVLTRKLNINANRLKLEKEIGYEVKRNSKGRKIHLMKL